MCKLNSFQICDRANICTAEIHERIDCSLTELLLDCRHVLHLC